MARHWRVLVLAALMSVAAWGVVFSVHANAYTQASCCDLRLTAAPNPAVVGRPVTFTASIEFGCADNGTLSFFIDNALVAREPVTQSLYGEHHSASYTTIFRSAGQHDVFVQFDGSFNDPPCTTNADLKVSVVSPPPPEPAPPAQPSPVVPSTSPTPSPTPTAAAEATPTPSPTAASSVRPPGKRAPGPAVFAVAAVLAAAAIGGIGFLMRYLTNLSRS